MISFFPQFFFFIEDCPHRSPGSREFTGEPTLLSFQSRCLKRHLEAGVRESRSKFGDGGGNVLQGGSCFGGGESLDGLQSLVAMVTAQVHRWAHTFLWLNCCQKLQRDESTCQFFKLESFLLPGSQRKSLQARTRRHTFKSDVEKSKVPKTPLQTHVRAFACCAGYNRRRFITSSSIFKHFYPSHHSDTGDGAQRGFDIKKIYV